MTTAISFSLFLLALLCATTGASSLSYAGRNTDIQALLSFKSGLSDPLGALSGWNGSTPNAPCDWRGVTCHVNGVSQLRLPNLRLAGALSPNLANLRRLQKLSLHSNSLTSSLPHSLSRLQSLTAVYLNDNRLSGELPPGISNLTSLTTLNLAGNHLDGKISGDFPASLRYLDLSSNSFSGPVPANFSTSLRLINLSFNRFSGEIPASIGTLQTLEYLWLDSNDLYGTIPSAISNCSSLIHVSAGENSLRGLIPATIGLLPNLQVLSLSNNRISGSVPFSLINSLRIIQLGLNALTGIGPGIGNANSSNLQVLDLHGNNINDNFPSFITNISTLTYLDVSNNSFTGNLPREIGYLVNLKELRLANNSLNGELPTEISKCTSLKVVDLENNQFSGPIIDFSGDFKNLKMLSLGGNRFMGPVPSSLGSFYELESLNLGNNDLFGPLPKQLMKLSNLSSLELGNNRFSGEFPSNIGDLKGLRVLNMSNSGFSGKIPVSIGTLLRLTILDLSKQNLSSELPFELFGLPNLQVVALDDNKLSGAVPEGFSSLSNLRFLNLSSNYFTNEIPVTYGFLQSLSVLSLSRNSISGSIPTEIGNCSSLEILELRSNNLTGNIPNSISRLGNLQKLDLGANGLSGMIPKDISNFSSLVTLLLDLNKLSGPIPSSLAHVKRLTYLNLSHNNLEGEIPQILASRFRDPSVFAMNKGLCGRPLSNNCKTREKANKSRMILLLAVAISGSVIIGLCCCGYLIAFIYWQRKLRNGKNGEKKKSPRTSSGTESEGNRGPKLIMFNDKITYGETVEATRNFDEENVLSRGKYGLLFKATYLDGMVLSIRRLPDPFVDVATFKKEAENLGDIKHKNLTVLRGYFAGLEDVRLLIYDYMPNGNLATLLQEASHQDGHILNWPMRHLIALGVARGLAFLHSVSIFHGDVNPQNVLFDADFEAHLSDFGLEKLTMVNVATSSSIGTVGYVAPEVALTSETSKESDVYSFGIVLLEILTGRKPVMFQEDENIVKWVKKQLQSGQIMELLEPGLLDLDPESSEWEEFLLGVKVGLLCTSTDPSERPSMTDVVFMLEGCRVGPEIPSSADPTTLHSPV